MSSGKKGNAGFCSGVVMARGQVVSFVFVGVRRRSVASILDVHDIGVDAESSVFL